MKRGSHKRWWVVPCTSKKSFRTESRKDIEEILKDKLATIKEEPETYEENRIHLHVAKRGKQSGSKVKMRSFLMSEFSIKDSYRLLLNRRGSSRGCPSGGIPRS